MIQIVIQADISTGQVQVTGPLEEMRIMHWALGEALRICIRQANEREAAARANGGPKIVLARGIPPT